MAKRKEWTPAELALLRSSYGVSAGGEIAKAVGRSKMAVYTKARDLGLIGRRCASRRPAWRVVPPRQKGIDWVRLALVFQERCAQEGVTPAAQAKSLGVAPNSMSCFLGGLSNLSATNLLLICDWAGLDPLAFLEDVADLPATPARPRGVQHITEVEVAHA
jgi:hypothetical protein